MKARAHVALPRDPLRGARVERHKLSGAPRRMSGMATPPSDRDPREIADDFVRAAALKLRIDPDSLRYESVKKSILGSHVLYQQYRDDVPISGAWLRIDVGPDGRVFHVLSDILPPHVAARGRDRLEIGVREADARARAALDAR